MMPDPPERLLARWPDDPRDPRPRAIVIGAGFGGLAAAVRLSVAGWRVQVIEKLDEPGGRASVFRQDGYTCDAGPTLIIVPQLFDELWSLAGARLEDDLQLVPLDPFYRLRFHDGDLGWAQQEEIRIPSKIERQWQHQDGGGCRRQYEPAYRSPPRRRTSRFAGR